MTGDAGFVFLTEDHEFLGVVRSVLRRHVLVFVLAPVTVRLDAIAQSGCDVRRPSTLKVPFSGSDGAEGHGWKACEDVISLSIVKSGLFRPRDLGENIPVKDDRLLVLVLVSVSV